MNPHFFLPFLRSTLRWFVWLLALGPAGLSFVAANPAKQEVVTYEAFGAVGDGVTDDLPAIRKAHAHANRLGLPVRSKPGATYHLGRKALTAIIATNTDWSTSKFIIDDSQGVEDHQESLFEVRSLLKPIPIKIDRLARGQKSLGIKPPMDCLVHVVNENRRIFIRKGPNRNDGVSQQEVFILRRDGSIFGGIDWDYNVITHVEAEPIDPEPLVLRGGIFTNIANRAEPGGEGRYWARNISIKRSNTVVDGVVHRVTGEGPKGQPYSGFLNVRQCARVTLRNCVVDSRKFYMMIGRAGTEVAMGTYGYHASLVLDFRMIRCRMGNDIHDRSRWGVVASNFMKNFLVEECVLSRVDVHMGISGAYYIRRSTIGHAGINAIGRGQLLVEDSVLYGGNLVSFRPDYGSTWDGEVVIRNCQWHPRLRTDERAVLFGMSNDGSHNFGYACSMPRRIKIDQLLVHDNSPPDGYPGIAIFSSPMGGLRQSHPFPYLRTEEIEMRGLKVASGRPVLVAEDATLAEAIKVVNHGRSTEIQRPIK